MIIKTYNQKPQHVILAFAVLILIITLIVIFKS